MLEVGRLHFRCRMNAVSNRGHPQEKPGAVILIPKHLRLDWMDVLALDPALPPTPFKVAGIIGYHFNHGQGGTFIKQETIARIAGLSDRTVWAAIIELERRGYLIVKRRDLGTTVRHGRNLDIPVRNAGGKGVANTYLPAFQRSQVTATNTGRKLAEYCELTWEQRSQNRVAKVAADCEPTLKANPLRASARVVHQLGEAGDLLCQRIGDEQFGHWFLDVWLEAVSRDTVRLSAPSAFVRNWLLQHHLQAIVDCWQRKHSSVIERVQIVVRSP
jgi:biotin operon repressor